MHATQDGRSASLYPFPAMFVLYFAGFIPFGFVIFYSLHDIFSGNVFVWVGAEWFEKVLGSPEFYHSVLRSLSFSLIVLSVQIPLGVFVALKMPTTGKLTAIYLVLLAIPMLTPTIVVGYLWKVMIQPEAGLLHQSLAGIRLTLDMNSVIWTWAVLVVMDTWHWTGLVVLLCCARLRTIPNAYYQTAAIDSASRWAIFRRIELPRLKFVLAVAVLLRFMDSFTLYTEAYVNTRGGPELGTVFLSHELVQTGLVHFDLGEAGSMPVIYFLIVLFVCATFYRMIVPAHDGKTVIPPN